MTQKQRKKRPAIPFTWRTAEQHHSWPEAAVLGDTAIGRPSIAQYRVFADLYAKWKPDRENPLPIHLVFANLRAEDPAAQLAFLQTYGPLSKEEEVASEEVIVWARWAQAEMLKNSFNPAVYWEEQFRQGLPLMPPGMARADSWWKTDVKQFWPEQRLFALLFRIWAECGTRHLELRVQQRWQRLDILRELLVELERLNPEYAPASLKQYIQRCSSKYLVRFSKALVTQFLADRTSQVSTALPPATDLFMNKMIREWSCPTLLDALYMMFFQDFTSGDRFAVQCGNCNLVFVVTDRKVRFCSSQCEATKRTREYRKRQKK
jgi:hypothetical protein